MQLQLDLSPPACPALYRPWLDVTPLAFGIGFSQPVEISLNLHDALKRQPAEYDQRLYDALWLAHFQLALDCAPFTSFTFPNGEETLRLRVELQPDDVRLGLPRDFQEVACPTILANTKGNSPSSAVHVPRRRSRTASSLPR